MRFVLRLGEGHLAAQAGAFLGVGVECLAHTCALVDLARSDELVDERRVQHLVSIVVRTVRPVRIVSYERGVQHLVRIVSRVGIVVRILVRIVVSRGSGVSRVSSVSVAPLLTLLTLSTDYSTHQVDEVDEEAEEELDHGCGVEGGYLAHDLR